jgi:putative ABC transport system substrate-binding protein
VLIKFGDLLPFNLAEQGVLDLFEQYGYVDGENIEFFFASAEFDTTVARTVVEQAISAGADILITTTTPVSQAALELTSDLENPPIVLFNLVTDPYSSGLAEASCIKAAHISGSQAADPYDIATALLPELNPDIETVGYMYNDQEANSVRATELVEEFFTELGIEMRIGIVNNTESVAASAEQLAISGIDAFFIPTDSTVSSDIESILFIAEGLHIPVIGASRNQVYSGTTLGIGFDPYYGGVVTARMAIAYLEGTDIATIGISSQTNALLGVNLDSAAAQNVTIPSSILDRAAFFIEDGESTEIPSTLDNFTFEEIQETHQAFLEEQFCSQERIDEQQAELDG